MTRNETRSEYNTLPMFREDDGTLASSTSLGGYPLIYFTDDGLTVCPECANRDGDDLVGADVHWEGEPLCCDDCSKPIESAYGPVEE